MTERFNAPQQANEFVSDLEAEQLKAKWAEFARYQADFADFGDPLADMLGDEVLEWIEEEETRLDPNGERAIDVEEVWRATGEYYRPLSDDK